MNKVKGPMKVNQWTLGLAAAGAIAFAAICSMASKSDPPAQVAVGQSLQTEIIAATADTLAENTSPPRVAVAIQNDAVGTIAETDLSALNGKELAFGPKLAAGVVSYSFGTAHTATVAHLHPRVMAIPTAVVVVL